MNLQLLQLFAAACDPNKTFFGLPVWYKYLPVNNDDPLGQCRVTITKRGEGLEGVISTDYALIALAGIDMLLRIAGMVAVGFVIYGGIRYVTSQGEPENTKNAMSTIINALIGLVIAFVAAALVSFIGNRLGS